MKRTGLQMAMFFPSASGGGKPHGVSLRHHLIDLSRERHSEGFELGASSLLKFAYGLSDFAV